MGFMDELRKLTQPYDDEDDFFEGADGSLRESQTQASPAQLEFESSFASEQAGTPEPAPKPRPQKTPAEGSAVSGKRTERLPSPGESARSTSAAAIRRSSSSAPRALTRPASW